MQFDRIAEIVGLWPHYIVAGLAVPIVVGILARKVMLTLFSALLSLLALTLLFEPSSTWPRSSRRECNRFFFGRFGKPQALPR